MCVNKYVTIIIKEKFMNFGGREQGTFGRREGKARVT